MTDTPKAVTLATMKQLAKERGIEPCHDATCDQVACYRVCWLIEELYYCAAHTQRLENIASAAFGMSVQKTRIPLPVMNEADKEPQ